jgi:hypothetical protein
MPLIPITNQNQNELARTLKHEGVRIGEIIAYRAWRVIHPSWFRSGDDRLHSVLMRDYVWYPDKPASGDVRTHGIYSFQDVIRSKEEYGYDSGVSGVRSPGQSGTGLDSSACASRRPRHGRPAVAANERKILRCAVYTRKSSEPDSTVEGRQHRWLDHRRAAQSVSTIFRSLNRQQQARLWHQSQRGRRRKLPGLSAKSVHSQPVGTRCRTRPAKNEIPKIGLGDRGQGWRQRSPIRDAETRRHPTNAGIPRGFPRTPRRQWWRPDWLAGAPGFEPGNGGIKISLA